MEDELKKIDDDLKKMEDKMDDLTKSYIKEVERDISYALSIMIEKKITNLIYNSNRDYYTDDYAICTFGSLACICVTSHDAYRYKKRDDGSNELRIAFKGECIDICEETDVKELKIFTEGLKKYDLTLDDAIDIITLHDSIPDHRIPFRMLTPDIEFVAISYVFPDIKVKSRYEKKAKNFSKKKNLLCKFRTKRLSFYVDLAKKINLNE